MDFTLPSHTAELAAELRRWARGRPVFEVSDADDVAGWKQLVEFGVFDLEEQGGDMLDLVSAVEAISRAPLPGPVIEAEIAMRANAEAAAPILSRGGVVTSVGPTGHARTVVGWGARADLVVSSVDGAVVADEPCPVAHNAFGMPHGWIDITVAGVDGLQDRRWLLASAATVGLATGAYEMALQHAKDRSVFGKPLTSRQSVQVRLAECTMLLQGASVAVQDAGWRWAHMQSGASAAAALTWLYTADAAMKVFAHAHQLFGALGFCDETGLLRYSSQARWLRLSVPPADAAKVVWSTRARSGGTPPSLVLRGFAES
ncbi:acyl-CoA dehydrogenase family protein [Rhodococcus koreensis]